jgi:hypothetical protein
MSTEAASPSTEAPARVEIPESTNLDEAARLLDVVSDDEEGPPPANPNLANAQEEGGDVVQPQEGATEGTEAAEGQEQEVELPTVADAPEFWSAEDKALFLQAPPELRDKIKSYEAQRIKAVNEKTAEAAAKVREAQQGTTQLLDLVKNSAEWWQKNGQEIQRALQGRWATVDWADLSANNPAEYTRLKHLKEQDDALLAQAREQGERDMRLTEQRTMAELAEKKRAAHEAMAAEMPDHFGAGKYEATYSKLGEYLSKQGIPAARINAIHEAPIIRMAMKSMLWDEAQTKASVVATQTRDAQTGKFIAKTTPMKRVQPGPATRVPGNQNAEQARQVGQRYFGRESGGDIKDAAELIRLRNL